MPYGFEVKVPAPYPLSQFDLANQIAILGMEEGWGIDYVKLTYKRWFEEGKEPATEPNLSDIFKILNLDSEITVNKSKQEKIKNLYEKNTEEAYKKGVFGSPTFIYNDELFWGDDRLEDCIKWLRLKST